mgnify:CR=1 FL=1
MEKKEYEKLTKDEVMNLRDEELLEYINYMLSHDYTMARINREKGIRRQTIRDRLKRIGYRYDENVKQYVKTKKALADEAGSNINEEIPKVVHKTEVEQNNSDSELLTMIRNLQNRQAELEARLDRIEGKDTKLENKRTGARLPITVFKSEAKIKNYPIYPEVFERITQLKIDNPHLKVKDIVNSLLKDALDRLDQ